MLFSTRLFWYILSLFLLLSLRYAGAVEKNRTIDDPPQNLELGPVYFGPAGAWQHEDCVGCPFQLDRARVFNGTWSVGTAGPFDTISVTFSFTGTAIYIFFITPNQISGGNFPTLMECVFVIDGQQKGSFQYVPDGSQDIQYDVLAFHITDLPNIDHAVRFNTPLPRNSSLLLLFDYAIYTFDDEIDPTPITSKSFSRSSSSSSTTQLSISAPSVNPPSSTSEIGDTGERKPPIGAIIGGIIGGLAAVLGIVLLLCVYRSKKATQRRPGSPMRMHPPTHHEPTPTNELDLHSSLFAFRKSHSRQSIRGVSRRAEKPPLHPPTNPAVTSHTLPISISEFPSTSRLAVSPALVDDAFRARQMDLERQLHAVEEELREIGPEPINANLNIPPMVLRASVYNESRHLPGGPEEPLPEYSERGTRFLGS